VRRPFLEKKPSPLEKIESGSRIKSGACVFTCDILLS
jgi:hypothetical protein